MTARDAGRVLLRWGLPAVAVGYLAWLFGGADPTRLLQDLTLAALAVAAVSAIIYGFAFHLLALAWAVTLKRLSDASVDLPSLIRGYAVANFAKYLPGSVLHYVGRQVVAARLGCAQKVAAQATAMEMAFHLLASGILLALLLPFAYAELGWLASVAPLWNAAWPLLLIVAVGGLAFLCFRFLRRGARPAPDLRIAVAVLCLQLVFFTLATAIGLWLAVILLAPPLASLPAVAFAFLFSWLVAFVVPGAPGGLGVREACLATALQPYGDLATILLLVTLSRIVLVAGEGLFALAAHLLWSRARRAVTA